MYNIYFEVAAIGFVALYLLYLYIEYPNVSLSNRRYRQLVMWLLFSEIFDVITAVTIDRGAQIPPFFNMLLNTIFFLVSAKMGLSYVNYVESFLNKTEHGILYKSCSIIYWLYVVLMVGNVFGRYCFWFDENGKYIHATLYPLTYGSLVIICVLGLIYIFWHQREFEKRQKMASWLFLGFLIIGFVLQIILFQHTLLAMYMASLAVTVFLFVIETPDYQKLEKAMRDLDEARKKADEANQAKSIFLAKMSHEIRTPINAVIGMNELILREEKNARIQEHAMDIKRSADSLLSTINDILDLSKVESGKMEIVPIEYDVSSLLHDVINMISFKAKDKGIQIELSINEAIPSRLFGDDVRIRQILVNILNNAVKYTEKGTVTFIADVSVIDKDTVSLQFTIRDTGIGIKEEDMEKLFSEYSRIDEKRNRNIEGTGLGMSITQQLLELMGSKLAVESVYGEGSCFSFELIQKIVESEPIGNLEKRISEQAAGYVYQVLFTAPEARLLLVDDNATNRRVCAALLEDTLVKIDEAAGGYECLEMVSQKQYDVILLDHMMPDLDGIETLKQMNLLEVNPCRNTPVVALTANAIAGAEEMYKEAGFTSFLAKPIKPEKLERLLMELLPKDLVKEGTVKQDSVREEGVEQTSLKEVEGFDWEYALLHMKSEKLLLETITNLVMLEQKDREALQDFYRILETDPEDKEVLRQYRVCVHSMKNSASMLGALMVAGLAKALEYLARDEKVKDILALHPLFIEEWMQIMERLREAFLQEQVSKEKRQVDYFMFGEYLKHLKTSVQEYDLDTSDAIMRELGKFEYQSEWKELMEKLEVAVKNIDEESALENIVQLERLLEKNEG